MPDASTAAPEKGRTMEPSRPTAVITQHLTNLREGLLSGLVERDVPLRLALLAAIAGEHLLLIGPPGTAKSTIARRLRVAFGETPIFERLLTKFTVPEELFGPLSIKGLEEDRYERLTGGYLPTASVAFLDEIFKANSAILNALLTLLEEREFDNGVRREKTPLVAVVGASNELPEADDTELAALFDRFLLRAYVPPVSKAGFSALLALQGEATPEVAPSLRLSPEDLLEIRRAASSVVVPDEVLDLLHGLRELCIAEKIQVSDRRFRKIVKLLQISAYTNGRDRVSVWDCWLLQHCAWNRPEEREKVYAWYASRVGTSAVADPVRLTRVVVELEGVLRRDRDRVEQKQDEEGRPLFEAPDGSLHSKPRAKVRKYRGKERVYLAPEHARIPNGYGASEVTDRTNGGNGFTVGELSALQVYDGQRWIAFGQSAKAGAYVDDEKSALLEEMDLKPALGPAQHKRAYVDTCLRDVATLRRDAESYEADVRSQIRSLEREIESHVWVTSDFAEPAARTLEETRVSVGKLLGRIDALAKGFASLPVESPTGGASSGADRTKEAPRARRIDV